MVRYDGKSCANACAAKSRQAAQIAIMFVRFVFMVTSFLRVSSIHNIVAWFALKVKCGDFGTLNNAAKIAHFLFTVNCKLLRCLAFFLILC